MSLEKLRLNYRPATPQILRELSAAQFVETPYKRKASEKIARHFPKTFHSHAYRLVKKNHSLPLKPLTIGALFSGGPASGGHNVLWGIFEAIQACSPSSRLIGFLDGPSGVVENRWRQITAQEIASIRNLGGFDLIGTGRTKIETPEQMAAVMRHCQEHRCDGLVIIGGDDSNTNAAHLAEYFLSHGCKTSVIGVPKTIDGDLRSDEIEISFGFDTACKTYSEIIGNICRDAQSAKKYTHFIKLMGRSASHIALECALATQPNLTLIGEEGKGLKQIVHEIAHLIERRKAAGKEYGVILVPEGLVEFIPEIKTLIEELNKIGTDIQKLSKPQADLFALMPEKIQKQLMMDRDPHGNVKVSQIETERLLMALVQREYKNFSAQEHFLGYEGRSGFPTNFDANYAYALGLTAALAVRDGLTGVICAISQLKKPPIEWEVGAFPIADMMVMELRKGKEKPVVRKILVDTNGKPFLYFSHLRKSWEIEDRYCYPGPIQFFGESSLIDSVPTTLMG